MNELEQSLYRKNKREARRLRKRVERESRRTNRGMPKPVKSNRARGRDV